MIGLRESVTHLKEKEEKNKKDKRKFVTLKAYRVVTLSK